MQTNANNKEALTEKSHERILWLDALRGIGIILVLLAHNNPPFIRLIFGFHMPLFYALSGYLFKDSVTARKPGAQILILLKRYIVPYFILCFANLILHMLHIMAVVPDHKIPFEKIPTYLAGILLVDGERMPQCSPLWFLISLAVSLLLFYFFRKIPVIAIRGVILAAAVLLTALFFANGEHMMPFSLHTILPAFLFLEIGYLLKKARFPEQLCAAKKGRLAICVPALLGFPALGYILIRVNPVEPWIDISKANCGLLPCTVAGAVCMIAACMLGCFLTDRFVPALLKPFSQIGKHTVFLLAFDEASNALGGSILQRFLPAWEWYVSFAVRSLVLVILFLLWQVLRRLIPSEKRRRLLDF